MKSAYLFFLASVLIGCSTKSLDNTSEQIYFCGVVFGFQISPSGELEKFEVNPPHSCGGGLPNVQVSDAWYKTACGYFSTQNHQPTYQQSEKPKLRYSFYLINPKRPNVLYPSRTAGSSSNDPVIYVQESILNGDDKGTHACDNIAVNPRNSET